MPKKYQDTVIYFDPITRQSFNYDIPMSCHNNPQNIVSGDLDSDEHFVLTLKPVLRATPMLFEPKQVQSAISPNSFAAQEPGIYSNAEKTNFWNRVSFTKDSDSTLKVLGKAISYDFLITSEQHPTDFYSPPNWNRLNPYNVFGVGLHDHLLNTAPLFAPDWFADAVIGIFGFPCYLLTQCGINFPTFLFLQHVFTFLPKFHNSISIKKRLHENINILSSLAHGFVKYTTPKMVTDLLDAEFDKRQRNPLQHLDDPLEYSSKIGSWKIQKKSVTENPEFMT